jgi:hypothetical protein
MDALGLVHEAPVGTVFYMPVVRQRSHFHSKLFPAQRAEAGDVVRGPGIRVWREVSSVLLCTSVSLDCTVTGVALVSPSKPTRTLDNVTWEVHEVRVLDTWPATSDKFKAAAKATQVHCSFDDALDMDCRYWPWRKSTPDLPCRVFGTGYPKCGGGPAFEWAEDGVTRCPLRRALLNNRRGAHEFWLPDGTHRVLCIAVPLT